MVKNMKHFIVLMVMPTMMHSWWWSNTGSKAFKIAYEACPVAKKLTRYSFLLGTLSMQNEPVREHSFAVFS